MQLFSPTVRREEQQSEVLLRGVAILRTLGRTLVVGLPICRSCTIVTRFADSDRHRLIPTSIATGCLTLQVTDTSFLQNDLPTNGPSYLAFLGALSLPPGGPKCLGDPSTLGV